MNRTHIPGRDERFRSTNADSVVGNVIAVLLVMGIAILAGLSVELAGWTDLTLPVVVIAALAALVGSALAKSPWPDSLAHLVAIGSGIGLTLFLTLRQVVPAEETVGRMARVQELGRAAVDWYLGNPLDERLEAQLISFLMATILWLVSYLSAWCLLRRGWVLATVLLPGFFILVNLGFAEVSSASLLTAYGLLSLLLLVRQNMLDREAWWRRRGLNASDRPGSLALVWGSILAVVATLIAVVAPASVSQATLQPLMAEVGRQATTMQESAAEFLERVTGDARDGQVKVSGNYSSFGDSFAIGGPLELGDTPEVVVAADSAPYLTAQTFDAYTGRGWYSAVEETFEADGPDGRRYSPEMTFGPSQDVPLSPDVMTDRTSQAVEIRPLTPTDGQLFTVDTFQNVSVEASVRMSWQQLDNVSFALTGPDDLSALPRELRGLGAVLLAATFSEDDGGSPVTEDGVLQMEIGRQVEDLASRFLNVDWTIGASGRVESLVVSGQLPVYDDVEGVSSRTPVEAGDSYRVVSATSVASAADLATAPTTYPDWVENRYLSLPETVTARTIELAFEVTEQYDNPYAKARALEDFIRATMIYDENVTAPPEGADIVDYLLFERQRGYCEYSATAMAVMLRAIGIPSRVVVGYAPGAYDNERAGFVYLQSDAHAWTEAYFPGYGWIPFEPTSSESLREDEGTGVGGNLAEEPEAPEMEPTIPPVSSPVASEPTAPSTEITPESTPVLPTVVEEDSGGGSSVPWIPLAVIGGIAAVAGLVWLAWSYPLRNLPAGSAFYFRLRRLGAMIGVQTTDAATPREFGRAMATRAPHARREIEQIVKTYEVDQFGPQPADERWLAAAATAWQSIRRQLPGWLMPWRRSGNESEA